MQRDENAGMDMCRLHVEQLEELRRAERQAIALFTALLDEADDRVASLLESVARESEIQLTRLEGLSLSAAGSRTLSSGVVIATPCESGPDAATAASRCLARQIAAYESACDVARRLGEYRALDILLLNLDEDVASLACLVRLSDDDSRFLRAV